MPFSLLLYTSCATSNGTHFEHKQLQKASQSGRPLQLNNQPGRLHCVVVLTICYTRHKSQLTNPNSNHSTPALCDWQEPGYTLATTQSDAPARAVRRRARCNISSKLRRLQPRVVNTRMSVGWSRPTIMYSALHKMAHLNCHLQVIFCTCHLQDLWAWMQTLLSP